MEMIKEIQHALLDEVHSHLDNLDAISTKEMEQVIHMIKNLSETMYYCSIVKAMESQDENQWESGK